MCFYYEADWTAEVHDEYYMRSEKECQCEECGDAIRVGDWCEVVHQQENECCQLGTDWCDDYDEEHVCSASGRGCDFGEEFDCVTCVNCLRLLESIWQVEEDEGCPEWERRPPYGEVYEYVVAQGDPDALRKYAEKFREMFPGESHRLLKEVTE